MRASAWLFGPRVLDLPLREPQRRSVAFRASGHNVLRGNDPSSFASFSLWPDSRPLHTQIDMLHVDIWWKGAERAR